jgi:hypothetical protein
MYYLAQYYTHRFGTFQAIAETRETAIGDLIKGLQSHANEWGLRDWIDQANIEILTFNAGVVYRDGEPIEAAHA